MSAKMLALAALTCAVGSAQALTVDFLSRGTDTQTGSFFSVLDTSLTSYIGGAPAGYSFVSLSYDFTANFVGSNLTGTATGGTGSLVLLPTSGPAQTLAFTFTGSVSRPLGSSLKKVSIITDSFSLAGLGLVGSGSFSANLTGNASSPLTGRSQTTFVSNLAAVPGPAGAVAFALGGLRTLSRRRRRRA